MKLSLTPLGASLLLLGLAVPVRAGGLELETVETADDEVHEFSARTRTRVRIEARVLPGRGRIKPSARRAGRPSRSSIPAGTTLPLTPRVRYGMGISVDRG